MNSTNATSNFSQGALTCHSWITQYINISRKDITLEELNSVHVLRLLGGITFVSLLAAIGLVGNIHVIYIFGWKFTKSTDYKVFVLWLGWIDIVTTSIYAPMLVYYLFKPLTFYSDLLCKAFRFLQYLCAICSNCALLVIAINRCLKILRPLRLPMTPRTAKMNCGVSLVVAVFLSWPAIPLFSVVNAPTGIEGFTGKRCLVRMDNFSNFKMFNGSNIIFFIVVLFILILSYTLIGWRIKHRFKTSRAPSESYNLERRFLSATSSSFREPQSSCSGSSPVLTRNNGQEKSAVRKQQNRSVENNTTGTLFLISLVYILSSLPYHILSIMFFVIPNFDCNLTFIQSLFFYIFIWSYLLNSVANPFVYGFRDRRFRKKLCIFYKKLCGKVA